MSSGMATHGCCYMCTCLLRVTMRCFAREPVQIVLLIQFPVLLIATDVHVHIIVHQFDYKLCAYVFCLSVWYILLSHICLFDGTLLFVVCPLSVLHLFVGVFTCCTFVCWYVRVLDVCLFVGM